MESWFPEKTPSLSCGPPEVKYFRKLYPYLLTFDGTNTKNLFTMDLKKLTLSVALYIYIYMEVNNGVKSDNIEKKLIIH